MVIMHYFLGFPPYRSGRFDEILYGFDGDAKK